MAIEHKFVSHCNGAENLGRELNALFSEGWMLVEGTQHLEYNGPSWCFVQRETLTNQMRKNSELGALVRKMPSSGALHKDHDTAWFVTEVIRPNTVTCPTPEEALRAALMGDIE